MKTYINYKVGLFIGLFSFSTLSSCVNTRRELGICGQSMGDWRREYNRNPTAFVYKYGTITGTALLSLAGLGYATYYYLYNSVGLPNGPEACGYNSTATPSGNATELSPDTVKRILDYPTRVCIDYLWNSGSLSPNATDPKGCNLYNLMAENNHTELLPYLADSGVDVNNAC